MDKGIFYSATSNLKMFIFNVYKNIFNNYNSLALLEKMLEFLMVLYLAYFQEKNCVYLFLWCPFRSLKLLIGFRF